MQNQATSAARKHAKTLRCGMTEAEQRLWFRLRREQLGVKFRRQHPVGPFIADFACLAPKVVVEVDGSQHLEQADHDQRRSDWLRVQGFVVLRFWANEVLVETDAVVERIHQVVVKLWEPAPSPALPQRGRESTMSPARSWRESTESLAILARASIHSNETEL